MSRIPYFSFYPADFMGGVRGLTAQEVGAYTMLLCRIYEENGPVEYHVRRLAAYCGMRESALEKAVDKLVDLGKLTLVNGLLSNARAEAEIAKRAHGLKLASRAGKISAEKKQQNQCEAATDVQRPFNHTDTDTDKEKREAKASPEKKARRRPELPLPDGWVPSDRNIADAEARNFTSREIDENAERFRNHHHAKGTRYRDWDAAWRTWLGNARRFSATRNTGASGGHSALFAGFHRAATGIN